LDLDDLPEEFAPATEPAGEPASSSLIGLVGRPLEEIEKMFIAETLRVTGGNREVAASKLGIGQRTLYRKIKEYGL
jgi:two-component system response regulator HydG